MVGAEPGFLRFGISTTRPRALAGFTAAGCGGFFDAIWLYTSMVFSTVPSSSFYAPRTIRDAAFVPGKTVSGFNFEIDDAGTGAGAVAPLAGPVHPRVVRTIRVLIVLVALTPFWTWPSAFVVGAVHATSDPAIPTLFAGVFCTVPSI